MTPTRVGILYLQTTFYHVDQINLPLSFSWWLFWPWSNFFVRTQFLNFYINLKLSSICLKPLHKSAPMLPIFPALCFTDLVLNFTVFFMLLTISNSTAGKKWLCNNHSIYSIIRKSFNSNLKDKNLKYFFLLVPFPFSQYKDVYME